MQRVEISLQKELKRKEEAKRKTGMHMRFDFSLTVTTEIKLPSAGM
jgi:hypothetical protein